MDEAFSEVFVRYSGSAVSSLKDILSSEPNGGGLVSMGEPARG